MYGLADGWSCYTCTTQDRQTTIDRLVSLSADDRTAVVYDAQGISLSKAVAAAHISPEPDDAVSPFLKTMPLLREPVMNYTQFSLRSINLKYGRAKIRCPWGPL